MSKYLLDKFLYTVDRDPELVERYRDDPAGTLDWWESEIANSLLNCHPAERSTWLTFTGPERVRAISIYGTVLGLAALGGQLIGGALIRQSRAQAGPPHHA